MSDARLDANCSLYLAATSDWGYLLWVPRHAVAVACLITTRYSARLRPAPWPSVSLPRAACCSRQTQR